MHEIEEEVVIDATPDAVWAVVGDLTAVTDYVPGIVQARMDGSTRVCVMADGQEIHEAISDLSAATRSYRYDHVKTPMPVDQSSGSFSVLARNGQTVARIEASLRAADPAMQTQLVDMMRGGVRQTLANLQTRVQGGSQ